MEQIFPSEQHFGADSQHRLMLRIFICHKFGQLHEG